MYKILLIVTVSLALKIAEGKLNDEMRAKLRPYHDECMQKTGAKEEDIQSANVGNFPEHAEFKCHILCMFKQFDGFKDGKVDYEHLMDICPDDMRPRYEDSVRKCGSVPGVDDCDTAFQTLKCYYVNNKEHFEII